jgi:hypothetical protein
MLHQQTSAGFFAIILAQELGEPNTDELQRDQFSLDA